MFFNIENKYDLPIDVLKARIISTARRRLLLYPFNGAERTIDNFLVKNYHVNLRVVCIKIFVNCKIMKNFKGELVITIPDKQLDFLASLITYGPDGIGGSKILQQAFKI